MLAVSNQVVTGEKIELRRLIPEDVGVAYLDWMSDPDIVRFTEARHRTHTLEGLKNYVASCNTGTSEHLLGIFELAGGRHVGNIKIGPISTYHRYASIGIIIGEKTCWGRGYATESIKLAISYAFDTLDLHKVTAGVIRGNDASLHAFINNGFSVEGTRNKHNLCEGTWCDEIILGLLVEDWQRA